MKLQTMQSNYLPKKNFLFHKNHCLFGFYIHFESYYYLNSDYFVIHDQLQTKCIVFFDFRNDGNCRDSEDSVISQNETSPL